MASDLDFIKSEKDTWGKVYVDICYAYDSVAPFLSEKTLKIRKYICLVLMILKTRLIIR